MQVCIFMEVSNPDLSAPQLMVRRVARPCMMESFVTIVNS